MLYNGQPTVWNLYYEPPMCLGRIICKLLHPNIGCFILVIKGCRIWNKCKGKQDSKLKKKHTGGSGRFWGSWSHIISWPSGRSWKVASKTQNFGKRLALSNEHEHLRHHQHHPPKQGCNNQLLLKLFKVHFRGWDPTYYNSTLKCSNSLYMENCCDEVIDGTESKLKIKRKEMIFLRPNLLLCMM